MRMMADHRLISNHRHYHHSYSTSDRDELWARKHTPLHLQQFAPARAAQALPPVEDYDGDDAPVRSAVEYSACYGSPTAVVETAAERPWWMIDDDSGRRGDLH